MKLYVKKILLVQALTCCFFQSKALAEIDQPQVSADYPVSLLAFSCVLFLLIFIVLANAAVLLIKYRKPGVFATARTMKIGATMKALIFAALLAFVLWRIILMQGSEGKEITFSMDGGFDVTLMLSCCIFLEMLGIFLFSTLIRNFSK